MKFSVILAISWLVLSSFNPIFGQFCFRGKPLKECKSFLIFEAAGYKTSMEYAKPEGHAMWEVGWMVNRNSHSAIGGTVVFGSDFSRGTWAGVKARYRYWLGRRTSFDCAAGLLSVREEERGNLFKTLAATADGSLCLGDLVGVTIRLDLMKGKRHSGITPYVGVKLGSYAGAVGGILVALIGGYAAAMSGM